MKVVNVNCFSNKSLVHLVFYHLFNFLSYIGMQICCEMFYMKLVQSNL